MLSDAAEAGPDDLSEDLIGAEARRQSLLASGQTNPDARQHRKAHHTKGQSRPAQQHSPTPMTPAAREDLRDDSGGTGNSRAWKRSLEWIGVLTGVGLLVVNVFQMLATKSAADAAKSAADAAKRAAEISSIAVEAEQRPWIVPHFTVRTPLKLDGDKLSTVLIPELKNTGHSPALGVHLAADLAPARMTNESNEAASARFNELTRSECKTATGPQNPITVFPGDPYESIPMTLTYDLSPLRSRGPQELYFAVSACVDYQVPVTGQHKQTTYVGVVNGNPDPILGVKIDAGGNITLSDTARAYEIVKLVENAN